MKELENGPGSAKPGESRNEGVEGDIIGFLGVKKKFGSAREISELGQVGDESGGEEGVEGVAGLDEEGVGLVCEVRVGKRDGGGFEGL